MDYQQSFSERIKLSPAEDQLEIHYNSKPNTKIHKFGFDATNDRLPAKFFFKINPFIRNRPDYIAIDKKAYFLEAKGCRDIAKFKIDDLKSYAKWSEFMPLSFFVFSTTFQKTVQFSIHQLRTLISKKDYKIERYDDNNKEYYPVPFKDLLALNKLK
jgi:hypothetical protein